MQAPTQIPPGVVTKTLCPSNWKRSGGDPAGSCLVISGSIFASTAAVALIAAGSICGVSGRMIGLNALPFFSS